MGSVSLCFLFTDFVVFVSELYNGTVELRDGTAEFKKETSGITDDVDEELDSFFDEMTGKDMEIGSLVSEKNTNINSVQFVIKTDGIQKRGTGGTNHRTNRRIELWTEIPQAVWHQLKVDKKPKDCQ